MKTKIKVYDYEESRRFFAEQGVTLLPPDGERYPPGSTTIIVGGVERRPEPRKGDRVQVCIETSEPYARSPKFAATAATAGASRPTKGSRARLLTRSPSGRSRRSPQTGATRASATGSAGTRCGCDRPSHAGP